MVLCGGAQGHLYLHLEPVKCPVIFWLWLRDARSMSRSHMVAGTVHLGDGLHMPMFSLGAVSLMPIASSSLPSSATEVDNCAEPAAFIRGFVVIGEGFLEEDLTTEGSC